MHKLVINYCSNQLCRKINILLNTAPSCCNLCLWFITMIVLIHDINSVVTLVGLEAKRNSWHFWMSLSWENWMRCANSFTTFPYVVLEVVYKMFYVVCHPSGGETYWKGWILLSVPRSQIILTFVSSDYFCVLGSCILLLTIWICIFKCYFLIIYISHYLNKNWISCGPKMLNF